MFIVRPLHIITLICLCQTNMIPINYIRDTSFNIFNKYHTKEAPINDNTDTS